MAVVILVGHSTSVRPLAAATLSPCPASYAMTPPPIAPPRFAPQSFLPSTCCTATRIHCCYAAERMRIDQPPDLCPSTHELARRALFAFIVTFVLARITVFLIMARAIPNLYFFLSDTHVHHLNYGIFLLAAVGAYTLLATPGPTAARRAAFVYGIAMALTFDEFGMWLHLGGSYWQRASLDATVVVAAALAFFSYLSSLARLEARHKWACAILVVALVVFAAGLYAASVRLGTMAAPRLRELELASSP